MNAFSRSLVGAGYAGSAALLVVLGGCSSVRNSIDTNQDFRRGAIESARKQCVQTAESKLTGHPELHPKIVSYCDCFATRGMAQFSNSELIEVSAHGMKNLTPEQSRKLNSAISSCERQAGIQ